MADHGPSDLPSDTDICVAPLSSPYSLLPRAHLYALAVTLILPLPKGWLFRAALAAFTTKTALFAIDAIVLLSILRKEPHHPAPLDVLVASEMLALASMMAIWLLVVSRTAGQSAARGLIRVWALTVAIGAVVAFVALREFPRVRTFQGDCDKALMPISDLFGEDKDVGSGFGVMGDKIGGFVLRVGIPGLIAASIAFLSISADGPAAGAVKAADLEGITPEVVKSGGDWPGDKDRLSRWTRWVLLVAVPVMAVLVIVTAEYYMLASVPNLPSVEEMKSVGQWGVWAATGVVLLATAINASREKTGLAEPTRDIRRQDHIVKF